MTKWRRLRARCETAGFNGKLMHSVASGVGPVTQVTAIPRLGEAWQPGPLEKPRGSQVWKIASCHTKSTKGRQADTRHLPLLVAGEI